ncbi:MAG: GAF domain-containing protein, partial [Polyangia bacterium]
MDTIPDLEQRLRVELRRADAVRELAQVLGATLELRPLLEALLNKVTELMDAERTSLFLVKSDGGLETWMAQGAGGTQLLPIQVPRGKGIAGWVATSGETVNIPDVYEDPRFDPSNDRRSGFTTRSMLCMPLPDHAGETMGVIQVLNKRGGRFDADDEALLRTVAVVAGINIENTRLYTAMLEKNRALVATQTELKEKLDELDILYRIETEAADAADQDELVERLLDRAAQLVGADDAVALLRDARSGELVCHRRGEPQMRVTIAAGQGIVGWVTANQKPVLLASVDGDARCDRALWHRLDCAPLSVLCVPLVGQGDEVALGALELHDKRNGPFDDEDRKLLTLIAGQVTRSLLILRAREERSRSSRLESVGQLVSGLLHDLKTPMTIASGYTQLMAESSDATERQEYAQSILKQFEILGAMTGEVLAFVRGESKLLVRKVHVNRFAKEIR